MLHFDGMSIMTGSNNRALNVNGCNLDGRILENASAAAKSKTTFPCGKQKFSPVSRPRRSTRLPLSRRVIILSRMSEQQTLAQSFFFILSITGRLIL